MYLHISNQMRKQDKTQYCQEYTVQSLTDVGAHRKSLAIATVQKMKRHLVREPLFNPHN
jgi:hypothetical protein